jgi:chromosome segregation ATPase
MSVKQLSVKHWLAATAITAGLCLGALPAFAQQQSGQQQTGDPVADAARKAREQQKTAPKPKKVYTDDDVKPATPATEAGAAAAAPQGSQGAAGAQATAENPQGAGGDKKEDAETAWKKRFADQRGKIASAEKELDILQREAEKAQVQYYNDPQKALMEQNTRKDINEKNAKIEAKKQEIASLKQQLSDLEDELRKSGGDPGWSRE